MAYSKARRLANLMSVDGTEFITTTALGGNAVTSAKIGVDVIVADKIQDDAVTTAKILDNNVTLAKMAGGTDGQVITYDASGDPVAVGPGTDGQVLTSTGAGSPPAFEDAGGAYSDWSILTTTANLAAKGQYICNHASTAFTVTLPAASVSGGNDGDTVIVANAGAATVTIARNSSNINSAGADGTLPQGNSVQLVYVDDTIGWFEV